MATNVTEKDKTLHSIIDWCNQAMKTEYKMLRLCIRKNDADGETWHGGCGAAYQRVVEHCESMLGYGGSMPTEVPNQAEDAKK